MGTSGRCNGGEIDASADVDWIIPGIFS